MSASWEHLLGGYATNTLTEEEKRQLFEAALHDQTVFDALADEETLKAMLANPEARRRLVESLQAHGKVHPSTPLEGKGRAWFREHSTLAWLGSIAAMGLALIFGWQMEKEWGPTVHQEQEAAKFPSPNSPHNRVSESQEEQDDAEQTMAMKKAAGQPEARVSQPSSTLPSVVREESPRVDRFRQRTDTGQKVDMLRGDAPQVGLMEKKEKSPLQNPLASSAPVASTGEPLTPASSTPAFSGKVEKPVRLPQAEEADTLADQISEQGHPLGFSVKAQFYEATKLAETLRREAGEQAPAAGLASPGRSLAKEQSSIVAAQKGKAGLSQVPSVRGIRYGFTSRVSGAKEEELEVQKITGSWKDILLTVEANLPGYVMVVAHLGSGQWQPLVPTLLIGNRQPARDIPVRPYQRVSFRLGQLTNTLGKLVVPSVRIVFSAEPLDDISQWLGPNVEMSDLEIEHEERAVYVVQSSSVSNPPLQVEVPLSE